MKKVSLFVGTIFSLVFCTYGIGLQHGLFRSQSTQGQPWQGTAEIIQEHYDIAVYPDYLDITLEWVFKVNGTSPAEYKDALEIVGNLNIVDNSVIVSMITWYKGMILKGKLKTNDVARKAYEDVVERDSDAPPPPRDPVLLEWICDDNYDISIFPVVFGETRKVRFRYLIPAFEVNGVNKIAYPHAFTDKATVVIHTAAGVEGYSIETSRSSVLFNTRSETHDLATYEFQAYSYSGIKTKERIDYIIPQLPSAGDGSVMYVGQFTADSMSGEMSHIITMSSEKALLKTSVAQDFVILWRWNHPHILAKYAGQIVRQSKLLKKFLETLTANNKRVAMIVDMEGGERVTFNLDKPGSSEYNSMVTWIDAIGARVVVEPKVSLKTQDAIQYDVDKSLKEFNDALRDAMAQFESDAVSLRYLLLLTAGPRLVTRFTASNYSSVWDSTINVNALGSYVKSMDISQESSDMDNTMYWPGVDMNGFISKYGNNLSVLATVGNGEKTYTLETLSAQKPGCSTCGFQKTTEAHLFSSKPLTKEILWQIKNRDKILAEYVETPLVVTLDEGMMYARLIGSSVYLNPLADYMPSSIASTLGFIDEKYSLVALEEDVLADAVAAQFESSGVPTLETTDIFPASDEISNVPVSKWLVVNPPLSMTKSAGHFYHPIERLMFQNNAVDFMVIGVTPVVNPIVPMRAAVWAVDVYVPSEVLTYDYSDVAGIKPVQVQRTAADRVIVSMNNGAIMVDFSNLTEKEIEGINLVVYNLDGKIIHVFSGLTPGVNRKLILSQSISGLSRGVYILQVIGKGIKISKKLILK